MPSRNDAHTELCSELKRWSNRHGDVTLWQVHQGKGRDRMGRHFRQGMVGGASDFVGVGPRGVFLAFEVKTGKAEPTQEQFDFLFLVNSRGGIGRVIRSVDDADRALAEARRRP